MQPKVIPPDDGRRLVVLGDHQRIILTGDDTGGRYTVAELSFPPGVGVPLHVHEREDEIFTVLEGTVAFKAGDVSATAATGTIVFGPRGVPHQFTGAGDKPCRMLVVVSPAGCEKMFEELHALPPGPPDFGKVVAICGKYGVKILG